MSGAPATIAEYLDGLPGAVRSRVEEVLAAVRAGLPGAEERVRYGMPAVMLDERYAVHVAGWKHHVGLYPVTRLPEPLESEVAPHRAAKDALRFEHRDAVPADLVRRVAEQLRAQRLEAG